VFPHAFDRERRVRADFREELFVFLREDPVALVQQLDEVFVVLADDLRQPIVAFEARRGSVKDGILVPVGVGDVDGLAGCHRPIPQ
jgi:hypothetical protein